MPTGAPLATFASPLNRKFVELSSIVTRPIFGARLTNVTVAALGEGAVARRGAHAPAKIVASAKLGAAWRTHEREENNAI